ncbi:MAG: protoheme IX farnesyltransferase, partial [Alphaproteobacteria bacterium]|nr:protoheme IX farnesyltransferase [Alphaproteobacteria bacterium]
TAVGLGCAMIALAVRVVALADGEAGIAAAKRLFAVSILYLFVLFLALLVDTALGAPLLTPM